MKFEPYSYFGGIAKKVTGTITAGVGGHPSDKVEWVLNGTWDTKLEASRVIGEGKVKGKSSLEVSDSELLWIAHPPYPESENFYNMSQASRHFYIFFFIIFMKGQNDLDRVF